jgi:Fe-S cluster assembly scaffold protein SufB
MNSKEKIEKKINNNQDKNEINQDYLIHQSGIDPILNDKDVAHLVIDHNKIISSNTITGLNVDVKELKDGINVNINLNKNTKVEKPVHICFGVLNESAIQKIDMNINLEENSEISILAHCMFPIGKEVQHLMDAKINIGKNAKYTYFEKHIHSPFGGVNVYPKAKINLNEGAKFKTEFELIRGRVGIIDIDYEANCSDNSTIEMIARISGREDDIIKINERAHLNGINSKGVLTSKVAVKGNAKAEVYSTITASKEGAIGHVDCKEIMQDYGIVKAVPIVEVNHPKAHVTHEAAIGGVDNKQLETLMARGLNEDEATDLIIKGLLS